MWCFILLLVTFVPVGLKKFNLNVDVTRNVIIFLHAYNAYLCEYLCVSADCVEEMRDERISEENWSIFVRAMNLCLICGS